MWGGGGTGGSGGGGGLDPSALAGYASMGWVEDSYVSKAFWNQMFEVRGTKTTTLGSAEPVVEEYVFAPNELPGTTTTTTEGVTTTVVTAITNIKVKYGLWSSEFLSALGLNSAGGGGGGATTLDDLLDVAIFNPSDGQVLMYNATTHKWYNGTVQGGSSAWADITGKPTTIIGYGITDAYIIGGTIYLGGNSITPLVSGDLNGYATQQWVGQQGFLTSSAISDMATKTWVNQQGFIAQSAADNRYLSIAFFSRLFQARNGNTAVTPNDTTTTIDNIKAMFGFWTDQYISALGRNAEGGSSGAVGGEVKSFAMPYTGSSDTTRYWHKLGHYTITETGGVLTIDLFTGDVYNGNANQNSWARIMIKRGNTTNGGTTNSVGVTCEQFGRPIADGKILVRINATAYNEGDVWVKCPWGHPKGSYTVQGNYDLWQHNALESTDTTTAPTHNQNAVGYYDNTSQMSTTE